MQTSIPKNACAQSYHPAPPLKTILHSLYAQPCERPPTDTERSVLLAFPVKIPLFALRCWIAPHTARLLAYFILRTTTVVWGVVAVGALIK